MPRPPLYSLALVVVLLSIVTGGVAAVADTASTDPAALDTTETATADSSALATTEPCGDPIYTGHDLGFEWNETFSDPLENGSLADWRGGAIAHVGGTGSCSLVVTDGQTTTLQATTINGSHGVVTGTLDLGANGSLRLHDTTATPSESNGTATPIALSNTGPDYATEAVVTAGNRSVNLSLSSGRFFEFVIVTSDNGTVRVAVWNTARPWDNEWDARVQNSSSGGDWRLHLDGRAFLDGIAIGTVTEPDDAEAGDRESEIDGTDGQQDSEQDESDPFDDDHWDDTEPVSPDRDTAGDSKSQLAFPGFLLLVGGLVGFRFAYGLTKFSEQMDAIGSTTRTGNVEPAGWNVMLTKLASAAAAVIGFGMLAYALL